MAATNGVNGTNGQGAHLSNDAFNHTVPLLIDGQEVTTEKTFSVTSPVTNHAIWSCSSASDKDAVRAAEAAQAALPAWRATKPSFRRDILLRASDIMKERAAECAEYMQIETGAEPSYAAGFNVPSAIEQLRDVAGRIVTTMVGTQPACLQEGKYAMMSKEPYGVILGISPWNAPYILGLRAISYAIAGGNTCILKGSELSPRCFWAIGDILMKAGLPPGVVNVIYHRPEDAPAVTSALIQHPFVKKINFTGSTHMGGIIAEQAGKALKPVLMELGGKAPAIVLADADLEKAAKGVVHGAFAHSGQVCMSTERVCVHESIVKPFEEALKKEVEERYPKGKGAPILVTAGGPKKSKSLIKDAVGKGARVLSGDAEANEDSATRMRPIVIGDINKDMDIYYTESFGPTVSVIPFKEEKEAIEIANDTEYGLSSSVFTEDLMAGLRIAKQIETGAVHINASSVHDEPNLPHGGVKQSGWGRFNGTAGIEEFLVSKVVTWMA